MSKNIIVLLQLLLSAGSLFLSYAGNGKPSLPFLGGLEICLFLIMLSWICLKKHFFIAAGIMIATHLAFILALPLNS